MTKDPYKYFRVEARELLEGLCDGILKLEKGAPEPEHIARMLRLTHTLKGAARVVKQGEIAELAHTIEGLLGAHAQSPVALSKEQANEILVLLDRSLLLLNALDPAGARTAEVASAPANEQPLDSLRIQIRDMDALLDGLSETAVLFDALRKDLQALGHARELMSLLYEQLEKAPAREASSVFARARTLAGELGSELGRLSQTFSAHIERADSGLNELKNGAQRLRLVPAQSIFSVLGRAVRDAAQTCGKNVVFESSGGDVRVDANVLSALRDALLHVVRNAVAHGAETESERVIAGKPRSCKVRLDVERRGNRVRFVCSDDGRGIDVEAVKRVASERRLLTPSEAQSLTVDAAIELLSSGGFTTSGNVTELAGRGIGLDAVRATTSRLSGRFAIHSVPGQGLSVEIDVPVSLAAVEGLLVAASGSIAAIPLDAVRKAMRLSATEIARTAEHQSIIYEGGVIPFLPLGQVLRRSGARRKEQRAYSAVIVQAAESYAALGVDELLGTSSILVRALPDNIDVDSVVAGASLDAEGNPQLVLDPIGIVAAAHAAARSEVAQKAPERLPVLVVDDSLTTRMLEQSILESAGYQVELATSAEDALEKAKSRRYSIFIVDVEMPGMDGFGFVEHIRADARLGNVPAILVTSRNAPEDRLRGQKVGANAYFIKSEFDQQQLLRTIARLIGEQ